MGWLSGEKVGDIKQRITVLQSTAPEKLGNKKAHKKDSWITLGRGIRRDLLSKLGAKGCSKGEGMGDEGMR